MKSTENVRALLFAGADPNLQDHEGKTALIWAVQKGYFDLVRDLIHQGADLSVITRDQETVLDISKKTKNDQMTNYLESFYLERVLNIPLSSDPSRIESRPFRL